MTADLETLAALEHEQWAHWTRYMLDTAVYPLLRSGKDREGALLDMVTAGLLLNVARPGSGDEVLAAAEAIQRWERQIATPYDDLSEKEKEADREWARKVRDS